MSEMLTIKMYKDKSTDELLISLGPTTSSLEDMLLRFFKTVIGEASVPSAIPEISNLKEDVETKKENADTSVFKKEEKEEVFLEPFIMKSGPFKGETPYEAICHHFGKAFPMFAQFVISCRNKDNYPPAYQHYQQAILQMLNKLEENFSELSEEKLDMEIAAFRVFCEEHVTETEKEMESDSLSPLDVKKKVLLSLVGWLRKQTCDL